MVTQAGVKRVAWGLVWIKVTGSNTRPEWSPSGANLFTSVHHLSLGSVSQCPFQLKSLMGLMQLYQCLVYLLVVTRNMWEISESGWRGVMPNRTWFPWRA